MEQKYQAVLAVIRDGLSIVEVANRFGVSRQSVHSWLLRYEVSGMPGLMDRSHRPQGCEHQMSSQIQVRVIELRRQDLFWGPKRIQHQLLREWNRPASLGIGYLSRAQARQGGRARCPQGTRSKVQTVGARRTHGVMADGRCRWHLACRWL